MVTDSRRKVTRLAPGPIQAAPPSGKVVRLPVRDADAALAAALRSDPHSARAELFDRFSADVERILYRILGADPELYDVLHEVFIAALTSVARLRDDHALGSWLTGIAVNKAKKLIRRRQRWRWIQSVAPRDLPEVVAPTASAEVSEALAQAYRILNRLSPDDRIAFALRHIDGMELLAIAQSTGVSLATAKRRIVRAETEFVALARKSDSLREWVEKGTLSK